LAIFLSLGSLFLSFALHGAQTDPLAAAAQAISVYPAEVRQATQTALSYPSILVQIGQILAKSRAEFQALSSSLNHDLQKKLWQVVRYPRLLRGLTTLGPKGDVTSLISNYPKEIQQAAKELEKNHFDLLRQSVEILEKALSQMGSAIQNLPAPTKAAFKSIAIHSAILQVLNQALGLSKIDPESFKNNPQALTQAAQKLSSLITTASPSTPPKTIQADPGDDPQAVAALSKANQEFRAQNDAQLDQKPYSDNAVQVNVGYAPNSALYSPIGWAYPAWFGSPAWDPFPYY
ncbi:MAG TPA: hypothetical protein VJP40_09320, partial [bacterium]|nr:hypothetical protein [bacterium]